MSEAKSGVGIRRKFGPRISRGVAALYPGYGRYDPTVDSGSSRQMLTHPSDNTR